MNTNKLKELAEEVLRIERNADEPISSAWELFDSATTPQAILGLISRLDGLLEQHGRDSAELRSLCQARDDARKERDRLKAENEALRQIVSECATACGAGCSPECTLDFMSMLPDEIASVVGKRARNAAIGGVVWQFIDRMTDVCEQDPAERILEQFVAAVRPAIDAALEGGGR